MVFDGSTGQTLTTLAGGAPIAIAPAANGATRLVGKIGDTRDLRVWSIPDGRVLYDITGANVADFSPDGTLIAAGGDGIRILRADTGAVREQWSAHFDPLSSRTGVTSIAFSPTGAIASVGYDETLRLWCSP